MLKRACAQRAIIYQFTSQARADTHKTTTTRRVHTKTTRTQRVHTKTTRAANNNPPRRQPHANNKNYPITMIVLAIVVCIKLGHEGVDVDRQAKPAHRLAKRSQTNRSALVLVSTKSNIGYARRRGRRGRKRSETIKSSLQGRGADTQDTAHGRQACWGHVDRLLTTTTTTTTAPSSVSRSSACAERRFDISKMRRYSEKSIAPLKSASAGQWVGMRFFFCAKGTIMWLCSFKRPHHSITDNITPQQPCQLKYNMISHPFLLPFFLPISRRRGAYLRS